MQKGRKVAFSAGVDLALLGGVERPLQPRATRELRDLTHRVPVVAETVEQFGRAIGLGKFFQVRGPANQLAANDPHLGAIVIDKMLDPPQLRCRSGL